MYIYVCILKQYGGSVCVCVCVGGGGGIYLYLRIFCYYVHHSFVFSYIFVSIHHLYPGTGDNLLLNVSLWEIGDGGFCLNEVLM